MASISSEFQARLDALCPAYRQFLAAHESDSPISETVVLYGRQSIEEGNTTHEVAEYLPDYVSIGNDSGDYEFLLRRNGSETVVWEDPGCFATPTLATIHVSFSQWLAEGCPLPEEPEDPLPLRGRIWLLAAPPGGLKDLLGLKKMLAMDWSIPQLKQSLEHLPAVLIEDGAPHVVRHDLAKQSEYRPLLGFSPLGSAAVQRFSDF